MQLFAKMCGWNEPEKHEFEHGFKEKQELVEVINGFEDAERHQRISVLDKLARRPNLQT